MAFHKLYFPSRFFFKFVWIYLVFFFFFHTPNHYFSSACFHYLLEAHSHSERRTCIRLGTPLDRAAASICVRVRVHFRVRVCTVVNRLVECSLESKTWQWEQYSKPPIPYMLALCRCLSLSLFLSLSLKLTLRNCFYLFVVSITASKKSLYWGYFNTLSYRAWYLSIEI